MDFAALINLEIFAVVMFLMARAAWYYGTKKE